MNDVSLHKSWIGYDPADEDSATARGLDDYQYMPLKSVVAWTQANSSSLSGTNTFKTLYNMPLVKTEDQEN